MIAEHGIDYREREALGAGASQSTYQCLLRLAIHGQSIPIVSVRPKQFFTAVV